MGTYCSHARTEVVEKHHEYTTQVFWKHEVVTVRCLDCTQTMRVDRCVGRITGHEYDKEKVSVATCKHEDFVADEDKVETRTEDTLTGVVFAMLTFGWINPNYRYHVTHATCPRCDLTFWVRSDFQKRWRDGKLVEERTSKWVPVTKREPIETRPQYKEVIVPVTPTAT